MDKKTLVLSLASLILVFHVQGFGAQTGMETAFYVWQRNWTGVVQEGINIAGDKADMFMILAAEVGSASDDIVSFMVRPNWELLTGTGKQITPVIRMGDELTKYIAGENQEKIIEELSKIIGTVLADAKVHGLTVSDIQIDHDCPTSKLILYGQLIKALREGFPQVSFSITALPTWLTSPDFADLIEGLGYYVLQVHSLERPESIDKALVLCDVDKVPYWVSRASDLGRPFFVALPTYGYQVMYDKDGRFLTLVAETAPGIDLPRDYQSKTLMSDSESLAGFVLSLKENPPHNCRGIVWFRMPIRTDRLNWIWPTLFAVMEGRAPERRIEAEIRNPEADLYELWVVNKGEINIESEVRVKVDFCGRTVLALDFVNGFGENSDGTELRGPAPLLDHPVLAAWYRLTPVDLEDSSPPAVKTLEVCPCPENDSSLD